MTIPFRTPLVVTRKEDTHGYYSIAEQIAKAIVEFPLPVTVGLSGHYGSGKSSIVAMVLKELRFCESDIRTTIEGKNPEPLQLLIPKRGENKEPLYLGAVFLDASLWQDSPDLFGTLLLMLARQFNVETAVKDSLKKILLVSLSVFNARVVGMKPGDVKELRKFVNRKIDTVIQDAANRLQLKNDVGEIFEHVLQKIREKKDTAQPRLLLILDNLDRVLPEQTMNLLKSVYMYIPEDIPVFILACFDPEFIEPFLAEKFGITKVTTYLSKYIDFSWNMPLPKRTGIDTTISKFLKEAPEKCFEGHENFSGVLAGMLHKAGPVNIKILWMVLRDFIFKLDFLWDTPSEAPFKKGAIHDTLQKLFKKVHKDTDLVKQDFGLRVISELYASLICMQWPWLYNAFYLLGESGQELKASDIIPALTPLCGKERLENDPHVLSFLKSYRYLTLWSNPGAHLTTHFQHHGFPNGSIRAHIIRELKEGSTPVETH